MNEIQQNIPESELCFCFLFRIQKTKAELAFWYVLLDFIHSELFQSKQNRKKNPAKHTRKRALLLFSESGSERLSGSFQTRETRGLVTMAVANREFPDSRTWARSGEAHITDAAVRPITARCVVWIFAVTGVMCRRGTHRLLEEQSFSLNGVPSYFDNIYLTSHFTRLDVHCNTGRFRIFFFLEFFDG